jgi:uncharacterized protein with FMN-binding domain
LQSSNLYTFGKTKAKRSGRLATTLISLGSIGAGVVLGVLPNSASLFPADTATTDLTQNTGPQTATGDAINYQYGTIQVSVTRENGQITAVDMVQAGANAGREQAFPTLQQAAIDANGSNFGNLSGATFTTDTFKQALDSAISKLG